MKRIINFLTICLFITACTSPEPPPIDTKRTFFDQLYALDDLQVHLTTDYEQLLSNKSKKGNHYQTSQFQAVYHTGTLNTEVKIRPRGVTRKKLCDYPPIMLKIKANERKLLDVRKSDNIKIVSPCKADSIYQQWIIKEYLVYQLYEHLTERSFRTKKITLSIQDSLNNQFINKHIGFIIEPTDVMAQRLDCTYKEDDTSPIKKIHKDQYKNYVLFQYMVGNTDWNLSGRHNIRILGCDEAMGPSPIPYDFDYSGLVNTDYATPHPMLPIDKVTDRLFQFRGKSDEDFSMNIQIFQEKKDAFYSIIEKEKQINAQIKSEMIGYLDAFYEEINDPENIAKAIDRARKR